MKYVALGEVLNVSALPAGGVSGQSQPVPAVAVRALRVYIRTTAAVEVYFYTGDGVVEDWGNLLGSIGGGTFGGWATLTLNPAALGRTVKFAVKNTSGVPADVALRVALFEDYDG
ncbi:hypothetical protein [Meiothermus granaticius]|uniref:Uncharacterized protein n=1 Tax=Meiothermus granaticius NBRC 107808 TaxID=1227551 RepID=A0A399FFM0_9DEIN|nr:hypothetical protein [Meiothermus granaticius]RIH93991.1 hypothetical protein Mgrana_00077 [Meiothermus granaticius NBRC 107808]GEM88180.1 hypothetical protein MGR01S_28050 [Meiothermus granaticius NBRC 107808]